MDTLSLDDVTKEFGSVRAVDGLSARIPAGSIYGFLGPNGAGKTTTLRMVMNIISPDSGRIEVLGHCSKEGVSERIGYMPEERGLYRKMKVRAVLSYFGTLKGMKRRDLVPEIARWLDDVGLAASADQRVEDLSRGMQQKLQFVVTAISDPDLLILDEPFSGLDPVNLELMRDIMLRMREAGKTVIFSTHMMEQAEKLCDFILLIDKGKKIIDGTLDEIRSTYPRSSIMAELEGETDFVTALPMVRGMEHDGRKLEITLTEDGDPQDLLRGLVEKVRVRSFEEKVPSLHEIFVDLVRGHDA
ncbi:MAG: ATP-binding cassette domain-containing protein [Pirellulales bacterium]|nr:ATP-binding cassette domain-containing protein [Pirellulales bacterium]